MHRETEMNSSQLTNDNMKSPIFTYLINFAKMDGTVMEFCESKK